ncbi:FAT domain-containing protein [Auriculariales sp. MPI-PUGE-AT-0066]|nr:FAT domain-containing protein [Auriculariales sp. MPI-PUGE-AT-0066]
MSATPGPAPAPGLQDLDVIARRLADPAAEMRVKVQMAEHLRDSFETRGDAETKRFAEVAFPVILDLLKNGTPVMKRDLPDRTLPEQSLRHTLLDLCHRPANHEAFRATAPELCKTMLHILRTDNEDNAITAVRILQEQFRASKPLCDAFLPSFMEFSNDLYTGMEAVINEMFPETDPPAVDQTALVPGMRSFKLANEIPLAAIYACQTSKELGFPALAKLTGHAVHFMQLEAPAQRKARADIMPDSGELLIGPASTIINKTAYGDLLYAQAKGLQYMNYILRARQGQGGPLFENMAFVIVRLLQDLSPDQITVRREIISGIRHLSGSEYRASLTAHIDLLIDERVLLGDGLGSRDAMRSQVIHVASDLIHQVRGELTPQQLLRSVKLLCANLHNDTIVAGVQAVMAKVLANLIDILKERLEPPENSKILHEILQCFAAKIKMLSHVRPTWSEMKIGKTPGDIDGPEGTEYGLLERAKPVTIAWHLTVDNALELLHLCRATFKVILMACKNLIVNLKLLNAHQPDGELVGQLFLDTMHALALYGPPPAIVGPAGIPDEKEILEHIAELLREVRPLVFQEVWTHHMSAYIDQLTIHPPLIIVAHELLRHEATSSTLVALFLKFLLQHLDELGNIEQRDAHNYVRLFKITFQGVTHHPALNERVLAPHLPRLVLDSLQLASRAKRPETYYILVRGLFRAIGGSPGRFEHVYKEVLPLLQEMFETLNRQLALTRPDEKEKRMAIVELCLTIPVRLTHLVAHLRHLMQPLVHSLSGPPEIASQGLRTLELCIDNLQPEFIDPPLRPVLPTLIRALNQHLKPLPKVPHLSHTTLRILGKLGGKNRLLLHEPPQLDYKVQTDPVLMSVPFGSSKKANVDLTHTTELTTAHLNSNVKEYRDYAFELARQLLALQPNDNTGDEDRRAVCLEIVSALLVGLAREEDCDKITEFLRSYARHLCYIDCTRPQDPQLPSRRYPYSCTSALFEAVVDAIASPQEDEADAALVFLRLMVEDIQKLGVSANGTAVTSDGRSNLMLQLAGRCSHLCHGDTWLQRQGGARALNELLTHPEPEKHKWLGRKDTEFAGALFGVLKNAPTDQQSPDVILDMCKSASLICFRRAADNLVLTPVQERAESVSWKRRYEEICTQLATELSCGSAPVREAASEALTYLAKSQEKTFMEIVQPWRVRIMHQLMSVPLRTLTLQRQIENMDAMTFLLSMDPPIQPDNNEELLRALHEAIGLADADDQSLINRAGQRQSMVLANMARVSGIRLTTASLPITEFYAKHTQTRQRVVSVYFKALYATHDPVKQAAKDGLSALTSNNQRLPRDFLQTGLRPILQSLSDTAKLTAGGLDGLARLMELLTNYFRVELGQRLVQHYKTLSDPSTFRIDGSGLVSDNETLVKLVGLVNIFHLLPPTANMYLPEVLDEVVRTEAMLMAAAPSCLSPPLGRYLNRYTPEAVEIFVNKLDDARYVRTLRNVIQSGCAPRLVEELGKRTTDLVASFVDEGKTHVLMTLQIINDLMSADPTWLSTHTEAYDALLAFWRIEFSVKDRVVTPLPPPWIPVALQILVKALKHEKRLDILFDVLLVCGHSLPLDFSDLNQLVHQDFVLSSDVDLRRNIITAFLTLFSETESPRPAWHLERLLHQLVFPLILASFVRKDDVVDANIIQLIADNVWKPVANGERDDSDLIKVGVLMLGSTIVQHRPELLSHDRKEIVRVGWTIQQRSGDLLVRQCSNIYLSRFYDAFESPSKFVMATLQTLVRSPGAEFRQLIKQALDILIPALPKRLPAEDSSWARLVRRMLTEDATLWQLVYGLVNRHRDVFFPHRQLFIPHILSCLWKYGVHAFAAMDGRVLVLDLVDVILYWERKAQAETSAEGKPAWMTLPATQESVVTFLIKVLLTPFPAEAPQSPQSFKQLEALQNRALGYLKDIASGMPWPDVPIKLSFAAKHLGSETTGQNQMVVTNCARLVNAVASDKDDQWFDTNAEELLSIIQRPLTGEDNILQDNLLPVFKRLVGIARPQDDGADEEMVTWKVELHQFIDSAIGDGLKAMANPRGCILMLEAVVEVAPKKIEAFAQHLNKHLAKFVRDSTSATNAGPNMDATLKMLRTILNINRLGVSYLFDQRKNLLTSLVYLLEKQLNTSILEHLLQMVRDWILHSKEAYPTMKEKANLMLKMLAFETRGEKLWNDYLQLVYDIYDEPSLRRTDLTQRLEPAFFVACRAKEPSIRWRFQDKLESSVSSPLYTRINFVFAVQNWDPLAEYNWLHIALELLLGSVDVDEPMLTSSQINSFGDPDFVLALGSRTIGSIMQPLRRLLFLDPGITQKLWVSVFSALWTTLSRKEQTDLSTHITVLLAREYHSRQAELRPNVIQGLLDGLHACSPSIAIPPFLLKHLGKTFGVWHTAINVCRHWEEDMFYGAWRTRNLYPDTNQAITFEQHGMWFLALQHYESAMSKARLGQQNYTEQEYSLWEDHYVLALQKMQMWDLLRDLSRNLDDKDLWLESMWRQQQGGDWSRDRDLIEAELRNLSGVATPRRKVFEAFLTLQKAYPNDPFKQTDFVKITDEANQLILRKWVSLPSNISAAHLPLLQHCQQFVELAEAANIFNGLAGTSTANLDKKSGELKHILFTWRERLPNLEDDIEIWSDLVSWRQHVFEMINQAYLPLIQVPGNGPAAPNTSTVGYRGYHETAWTINRYAETARKHYLLEVCHNALNKIYTLPNIEIAEAFRKLREQARCYYQTPAELQQGLEVINNTNLTFFSLPQKAEFFTLKGMFFHKLGRNDEANEAFSQAVNQEQSLYKGWAEWASYHDAMAQENQQDLDSIANALNCYMIAAGLVPSSKKCRPFLNRILWLVAFDDGIQGNIIEQKWTQDHQKLPLWYFLPLIPQLLTLLYSHGNASRHVSSTLAQIARNYPQALYYHVKAYRDDQHYKRAAMIRDNTTVPASTVAASSPQHPAAPVQLPNVPPTMPYEAYVETLYTLMKSTHPLLHITLERTVEAWYKCKEAPDEFSSRVFGGLLSAAVDEYNRQCTNFADEGTSIQKELMNTQRAFSAAQAIGRFEEFKADFSTHPPTTMRELINRLQIWRDRAEKMVAQRPTVLSIEHVNQFLASFQTIQFHDIEVPGQYSQYVDNNNNFVKVSHFHNKITVFRGAHGQFFRRFRIIGHDGSEHAFFVQFVNFNQLRHEERILQLYRSFNDVVTSFKETRRRSLAFHVPVMVPVMGPIMNAPNQVARLVQADDSYMSLQDVHDQFLTRNGQTREAPVLAWGEKYKKVQDTNGRALEKQRAILVRIEVLNEIITKLVPNTVLSDYLARSMANSTDLWLLRKQITKQLAAVSFMHHITAIPTRTPSRIYFSRKTGQIFELNMAFAYIQGKPQLPPTYETVPWRFTPNLQNFIGRVATEGLFTTCLVALGRALIEPEYKLDRELQLYVKDDVMHWIREQSGRHMLDPALKDVRSVILENVSGIVSRTEQLACKDAWDKTIAAGNQTAVQPVISLVSDSTKLQNLANTKNDFYAWY